MDRESSSYLPSLNGAYLPNSRDTLPSFAYTLAFNRRDRGEVPCSASKPSKSTLIRPSLQIDPNIEYDWEEKSMSSELPDISELHKMIKKRSP